MPDFDLDAALHAPPVESKFAGPTDIKVFWVKPDGEDWIPVAGLSVYADQNNWANSAVCVDCFYIHLPDETPGVQAIARQRADMVDAAGEPSFEAWRERLIQFWWDNKHVFTTARSSLPSKYSPLAS